jgi:hypothetical protein
MYWSDASTILLLYFQWFLKFKNGFQGRKKEELNPEPLNFELRREGEII